MLSALVVALLSAAPAQGPVKLAAPGLTMVGLENSMQEFYTNHLAQQLRFRGVQVSTSSDISAVLGLERQKQLLGCPNDSCTADFAAALGVDGLVLGTLTRLSKSYAMDLRVVASGDARVLAQASSTTGDADQLVGSITVMADQLATQVATRLGRTLESSSATQIVRGPTLVRRRSWIPAVVGVAALAVGGLGLAQAKATHDRLNTRQVPPLTPAQADELTEKGRSQQQWGWVGIGAGAAALVAAGSMYVFGGEELITSGVAVTPGQASFFVVGVFP